MVKKLHFLSGLPRSGNTVLSAILNQNPTIYSSPLSELSSLMYNVSNCLINESCLRNEEILKKVEMVLKQIPNVYYSNIDKPIIFDREKAWGTPYNLSLIKKYITPNPKIIFTVRTITEILASYVTLNAEHLKNDYLSSDFYSLKYLTFEDGYVEYLMRPNGEIEKTILSLAGAMLKENEEVFHLVEYDDLVNNPTKVMNSIYDFLEIPKFKHNFNKIHKKEVDNDEILGYPKNMHEVRIGLGKTSLKAEEVLSPYIMQKYKNTEFWRKESSLKVNTTLNILPELAVPSFLMPFFSKDRG